MPKERYHHGDLRRALIDAALALVTEEGVAGLTLRRAARLVGVTHAAPYRHFRDKAALLAAVAEEGFEAMQVCMAERAAAAEGSLARFQAVGEGYVSFVVENPACLRIMFGPELAGQTAKFPGLLRASHTAYNELIQAVVACQADGIVSGTDPDPAAVAAWSMVHGLSALLIDGMLPLTDDRDVTQYTAIVGDALFRGLMPREQGQGVEGSDVS